MSYSKLGEYNATRRMVQCEIIGSSFEGVRKCDLCSHSRSKCIKLDDKSKKLIFIDYDEKSKAYNFYDYFTKKNICEL
jgi:hypothetical protein